MQVRGRFLLAPMVGVTIGCVIQVVCTLGYNLIQFNIFCLPLWYVYVSRFTIGCVIQVVYAWIQFNVFCLLHWSYVNGLWFRYCHFGSVLYFAKLPIVLLASILPFDICTSSKSNCEVHFTNGWFLTLQSIWFEINNDPS